MVIVTRVSKNFYCQFLIILNPQTFNLSSSIIIFGVNFIYFAAKGMCYRDVVQESCGLLCLCCSVPKSPHCNSPGSCILISIHYPAGTNNVDDEGVVSWKSGNMEMIRMDPVPVILAANELN